MSGETGSAELRRIEGGRERLSPGFPIGLTPLCDPALIFGDAAGEDAAFSLLRVSWIAGAPRVLATRGERRDGAWRVIALSSPDLAAALTPDLVADLPGLLRGLGEKTDAAAKLAPTALTPPAYRGGAPSARDAAEKAAGRAVAAAAIGAGGPAILEAADETAFWRAVAAFIEATPPALRPAISAFYGPGAKAPPPALLAFARPGEAPAPATPAIEAGRLWLGGEPGGDLGPPIDDADARASLGRRFAAMVAEPGLTALAAFLTELEAAPAPIETPAALEMALGALQEGRCAAPGGLEERTLDDLGQARAAGLAAAATASGALWEAAARRAPERAFWRALALDAPAEIGAIPSIAAFDRLSALEATLRRAAPEGAATPFDAPVYAERLAAFAAAAPRMLGLGPTDLADAAAPALETLGTALKAALEEGRLALPTLAGTLDDLDLAARQGARGIDAKTLERLRAAAADLRARTGLAQSRRYAAPALELTNPLTVKRFAARWIAALEQEAYRAAAFWRDRFEAWIAAASPGDRDETLRSLALETGAKGALGVHLGRAVRVLGGPSAEEAAAREAPAAPETPVQPAAPRAPRKPAPALGAGANLQDVFASLRAGEAAETEGDAAPTAVAPTPAPEAPAPPAATATAEGDPAALATQAAAIDVWRAEFETERVRRAAGAPPQPIRLLFGDRRRFAALADALAESCLAEGDAAAAAFGAEVVWTLRQLAGIGLPPAQRPGFAPAPEGLRAAFAALAENPTSEAAEIFPLHLASKLLQAQKERALSANRLTDGFIGALAGASVPKAIGDQSVTYNRAAFGQYLWLRKRAGAPDYADLSDEALAERLDVVLMALSLVGEAPPAGPEALIEPIEITGGGGDARTLTPPKETLERLETFFSEPGGAFAAHKRAFGALMGARQLYANAALSALWRRLPR